MKKKAFTVIEMIVVITIVGLIASMAIPAIMHVREVSLAKERARALGYSQNSTMVYLPMGTSTASKDGRFIVTKYPTEFGHMYTIKDTVTGHEYITIYNAGIVETRDNTR